MIYLFAGDDTKKKTASYSNFFKKKSAGDEVFVITKNDFNPETLENFYSGSGLFFTKCTVVLKGVFEREEARDFVLSHLNELQDSQNDFYIIEGKLNKKEVSPFEKSGAKIEIFDLPKIKLEKFNNFLLADALHVRDKKKLWIYFRQATDRTVALEELVGVMFWKVKDMLTKRNFSKYSKQELMEIGKELSLILTTARMEGRDAEASLERFILSKI